MDSDEQVSLANIYLSRGLSAWGDRLWSFGVGIFMNLIRPDDLMLVSAYGLADCLSAILFVPLIGSWIDRGSRMRCAAALLCIQNLSTAICCAILALHFQRLALLQSPPAWVAGVAILLAIVSNLSSAGSKLVLEKDWIIVLAAGDNQKLASMNSILRTIDLCCLLLAPGMAGLFFQLMSHHSAAMFIAAWNLASLLVEYLLLVRIYRRCPDLQRPKPRVPHQTAAECGWRRVLRSLPGLHGWSNYFRHPICGAGVSLALLYMTVLGFDNITYGFCLRQCITEAIVGLLIAASAVSGVSGSICFPFLVRTLGTSMAGQLGMGLLITSLALCVGSIWLPGSPFKPGLPSHDASTSVNETLTWAGSGSGQLMDTSTCHVQSFVSIGTLLTGIIASRFGLWIADLSVSQLMQEGVEAEMRGSINGVQHALNSAMNMIKFILVILMPHQQSFGWLILLSYTFIVSSGIIYSVFVYHKRTDRRLRSGADCSSIALSRR